MRALPMLVMIGACASPAPISSAREQRVIDTLAEDNYAWALRDRALVEMKLKKMQREPYLWLRGTAAVYWRDLTELGPREETAFGDLASSRVLLVGDPHPENVGTFRAADGTMLVDWNDLDTAGYGPFTADVRRLATGMDVACGDDGAGRAAIEAYAAHIARLAAGEQPRAIGIGLHELLDKELTKAKARGDAGFALDELAPEIGGVRYVAFGDLEAVAADGVYEDTIVPVGAEAAAWIDRALAPARVVLRGRRIGSGVASYAALRFNVVTDDGRILELKEERDGLVLHGVPQWAVGPWASPADRAVTAQRALQQRPDEDVQLRRGEAGGLSLKVRDREAYQRGLDHTDFPELSADEQRALAAILGELLADAHGRALTADGVAGWTVIAPVLAGREAAFADELEAISRADADQVRDDHAAFADVDLAAEVLP